MGSATRLIVLLLATAAGCGEGSTTRADHTTTAAPHHRAPTARSAGTAATLHQQPEADAAPKLAQSTPEAVRQPLEITFAGDIIFGRWVEGGRRTIPKGDYSLFEPVAPLLRADLAVANLETPVVRDMPAVSPYGVGLRFAASLEEAQQLVRAGITHVTLANNHGYDMRLGGKRETPDNLRAIGITPIGLSHPEPPIFRADTVEHEGWRIAFIGITSERNGPQRKAAPLLPYVVVDSELPGVLIPVIEQVRDSHDLVIVIAHWGWEYDTRPRKDAQAAGRALIDAGADLVIGHHPHVLQGIERYGNGVIAYSLGNFRFDQRKLPTRMSGVLRLRFEPTRKCADRVQFHPVDIQRNKVQRQYTAQPVPAEGTMRDRILERIIKLSAELGTAWELHDEQLLLAAPPCSAPAPL